MFVENGMLLAGDGERASIASKNCDRSSLVGNECFARVCAGAEVTGLHERKACSCPFSVRTSYSYAQLNMFEITNRGERYMRDSDWLGWLGSRRIPRSRAQTALRAKLRRCAVISRKM